MAGKDSTIRCPKMTIADDQFDGPLVHIKNELNELENLKTFFYTLVSLSAGKEELGEQLVTELPVSMLLDLGCKMDCIVDSIFYHLHPRFEKDRQAAAPEGGE